MQTMADLFGNKAKEPTPTPLKHLLRLPSTADVEAEGNSLRRDINERQPSPETMQRYQRRLDDARRRDAIQATRPEGCWCLGLGGEDEMATRDGERYFSSTCTCPEGMVAEEHARQIVLTTQQRRVQERIANVWENAMIPMRFDGFRLDTSPWVLTHPDMLQRVRARDDQGIQSWFFYGPYGAGKTGIAIGLAWVSVVQDGSIESLRFVAGPRLFSELRSTYNRNSGETEQEVIDRYAQADLLILDDIGAEQVKNQDWLSDRLYQIVGERHDELRPTIFTSNLSIEQLAKRVGERVTWRIVEMVGKNIVHVDGPNLRA